MDHQATPESRSKIERNDLGGGTGSIKNKIDWGGVYLKGKERRMTEGWPERKLRGPEQRHFPLSWWKIS